MRSLLTICLLTLGMQAHAENYAIVGAKVHTMGSKGTLDNATVLIKDGKIEQVRQTRGVLSDYIVIDAQGKVITPGLIGAMTSLGLVEVNLSAGTVDGTSKKTSVSSTGAALDVSYGVNPHLSTINVNRIEGVTSAATSIGRNDQLFQGMGAFMTLGDKSSPVIEPRSFMAVNVSNRGADASGGTRSAVWVNLINALEEAQFAQDLTLDPMQQWHGQLNKLDVKALVPVVKGERLLVVDAKREADLRQVLALKHRFSQLNIAVLDATEGWRVAQELAQANIAVILNPESNLPYSFEQLGATMENAKRLNAAGVNVAIGVGTHNIRLVRQHAGNAVANGLPWKQGLAAITSNVAKVYGLDDRLGSLEAGKQADLVIWSGDPLEVTEAAEQVFIKGEKISMHSRQTKLRDRYLMPDNGKPVGYRRP